MTLREILEMPAMRRGVPEVLTGRKHLDRPIRWVHSGDVSYIASMLKGGELLLTTGMGLGKSAADQRRYVDELGRRRVAALAIELGTRFKTVPQALVAEAGRRQLTVIALHREIPFVEVTEAVHSVIVSRQLTLLRRSEQVHQRFFRLVLEGVGTPEILAVLAEMVRGPVFLDRTGQGVIYHDSAGEKDSETLAAWDAFSRKLEQAPAAIERRVPVGQDRDWGRLVALLPGREPDEFDRITVERAVEVIALALLRDREEESMRGRERGNFLVGLLRGDFDEATARVRATEMSMSPSPLFVPLLASRSPHFGMRTEESTSWVRAWADAERAARSQAFNMVAGTREHARELLAVVGIEKAEDRQRVIDRIASQIHEACARRLGSADAVVICAGATAPGWDDVATSLRALVEAIPTAAQLPPRPWHDLATPSLDQLLWTMRNDPELERFTKARLEPLIEHDRHRRGNLVTTLEAYCLHAGHKAETADALGIKRQSLYHRLRRIEQVLNLDLNDGDKVTELHLALRAHRARRAGD